MTLMNPGFIKMLKSPAGLIILGNVVNFTTMESIAPKVLMISNQKHAVVPIWNGLSLPTLINVKPWSRSMTWPRNGNVLLMEMHLEIMMKKKAILDFFSNLLFYWFVFCPIWYISKFLTDSFIKDSPAWLLLFSPRKVLNHATFTSTEIKVEYHFLSVYLMSK